MKITVHKHDFILTPEKVLIWPSKSLLAVADLHLGREATFQKRGLWLPSGSEKSDIEKLLQSVERHKIQKIVLLGDILHSKAGAMPEVFEQLAWLKGSSDVELFPVGGNHDRRLAQNWDLYFPESPMKDEFEFDNFIFAHEPPLKTRSNFFYWCGHLHPRIDLRRGSEKIRLPAYIIEKKLGVLPAFSSLAAGYSIESKPGRARYACLDDKVILV